MVTKMPQEGAYVVNGFTFLKQGGVGSSYLTHSLGLGLKKPQNQSN